METRNEPTDPADILGDELLAIRCQLGEPPAWDALVTRWHAPLWRYVRRLTGDDVVAHDTVQDVWLKVLRSMPGLRDPARLRPWLFGIARRTVMDRLRSRYAEPELAPIELADSVHDEVPGEDLKFEDVYVALDRLPTPERDVLVLFYLRELTLAQMAEVLAAPVGTVKSRLFRARKLLRRELTSDQE